MFLLLNFLVGYAIGAYLNHRIQDPRVCIPVTIVACIGAAVVLRILKDMVFQ